MAVDLVRAGRLFDGVPYAYAAIAQPGALVFTAGACPLDENGVLVGAGDVRLQAGQAMANLVGALDAAGAGLTGVLKTTIFGAIIAIVCCYKGMTASGGAEGVGRAVNQAVVVTFLSIFAFDYVFTQTLLATHPEILVIK